MTGATIEIRFADASSERRFLASHLPAAWDRFEASEHWEHGWFWPYGQFADYEVGPDGGLVRLVMEGDPDRLVASERDRWDAVDGLTDWTVRRYDDAGVESLLAQQRDAKGSLGGEREYRYKPLTSRLALAVRETFDDPPPPAPDPGDGDPLGVGMWSLVHSLYVQCGYDWYDETDACLQALRSRVQSVASYRGAGAARAEYDRLREAWLAFEADLEEWLEANPTGEASI